MFNKEIYDFDLSCLHQGIVNEASSLLQLILFNLLNCAYEYIVKIIVVCRINCFFSLPN